MKSIIWIGIVVIAIAIGFLLYRSAYKQSQPVLTTSEETTTLTSTGETKEFEITAKQFSFEPNTITVNKGDRVKLKMTSIDVTHGFAITEFGVNEQLQPGKTVNVEFVADKSGTFSFYCSIVCGAGHSGMRGQLVVK